MPDPTPPPPLPLTLTRQHHCSRSLGCCAIRSVHEAAKSGAAMSPRTTRYLQWQAGRSDSLDGMLLPNECCAHLLAGCRAGARSAPRQPPDLGALELVCRVMVVPSLPR